MLAIGPWYGPMDSQHLHGDFALAKHLLARLTPRDRLVLLETVPEFVALREARDMLRLRIAHAGSEPLPMSDRIWGTW